MSRPGLAIAAIALAVAGCGEERGDLTRTTPVPVGRVATADPRAVATVEASLVDYALEPPEPRVGASGLIAFAATNDGLVRHALAVDGPSGTVRTAALVPGERAIIAVRLPPGTYKWYCPLGDHEQRGMVGRVRVKE
jgi:uncharacterized cupredoxin-like copper-binding protein